MRKPDKIPALVYPFVKTLKGDELRDLPFGIYPDRKWQGILSGNQINASWPSRIEVDVERKRIEGLVQRLQKQERRRFPKVGDALVAPTTHGVYVIRDPAKKVVHVGRTLRGRKGISQRLHNHLKGQSSFVVMYLNGNGDRLRKGYTFQCLEIPDDCERALLEYYATAWHCPGHLGLGALRIANGNRRA